MSGAVRSLTASKNPFAVDRIRPGAIPFLFSHRDDATDLDRVDQLVNRWQASGHFGQIVGAHGRGKSTLAVALVHRVLQNPSFSFSSAQSIVIRKKRRRRSCDDRTLNGWRPRFGIGGIEFRSSHIAEQKLNSSNPSSIGSSQTSITIIDGIEVLSAIQRGLLLDSLRRQQIPTLITAHKPVREFPSLSRRWPVLYQADSNIELFTKVVSSLTERSSDVTQSEIDSAFASSRGNCRDALMSLYDTCLLKQTKKRDDVPVV